MASSALCKSRRHSQHHHKRSGGDDPEIAVDYVHDLPGASVAYTRARKDRTAEAEHQVNSPLRQLAPPVIGLAA
jgi:hypothetical protein